jgi:fluoroquinolone resistance protein
LIYYHNETLVKLALSKGEYECCVIKGCNLSELDLGGSVFIDCTFIDSNLSLANLSRVSFQNAIFRNCKMLGLRFDLLSTLGLGMRFENCLLSNSSFFKIKIRGTVFRNCNLSYADFTETDLTAAVFETCNLENATFDRTILEKADLSTSEGICIDADNNSIKHMTIALTALPGLLDKYALKIKF